MPFVLVQCKYDTMDRPQKMDAVTFEKISRIVSGQEVHRTSAGSPRTQKRCISILLRSIVLRTPGKRVSAPSFLVSGYLSGATLFFLFRYTGVVGLHQHPVLRRPAPFVIHRSRAISPGCPPVELTLANPCLLIPLIAACVWLNQETLNARLLPSTSEK